MEMQGEARLGRLVLVVCHFQGHINPMLQLATILHSKGFSITVVHPEFNSPDPSNHPEFTFRSIPDNLIESKVPTRDFVATIKALNKNCHEPLKLYMKTIVEEEHPHHRIIGVLYDALMYCAQSAADLLNLPAVVVRTSAAATVLGVSVLRQPDQEQGYISLIDAMSEDLGPEFQRLQLKSLLLPSLGFSVEELLEMRADQTSAVQKSSAMIVNTMQFLERPALSKIQQYFPAQVFGLGPFHKLAPDVSDSLLDEDKSCISWLDNQFPRSVIYVSFGSIASVGEKEFLEVARGLADSEQPFLWVIRPDLVHGSELNKLLPDSFHERVEGRGCIVRWAPQKEVLGHSSVGGFWTHCGWNSTLESVCEGVPMLCRPFFGDQPLNMRYICDLWKIGIQLEGELERGKIEKAVRRLMSDIEGEEMRQRAAEFKQKVELCLKEGGSTLESLKAFANHLLSS